MSASWSRSLIILSVIMSWLVMGESLAADDHPNIVLILADDMGIDSVSSMNQRLGLATPAIDSLARDGMSFRDAHSTSGVCTPTRYSVLTGRYNWRSRLKRGIVGRWERPLIADSRLTLPEMLREQGYETACIGKWHLGWHWPRQGGGTTENVNEIDFTRPVRGGPNDHGFDYAFGDDVPNWPPYVWRENENLLGKLTAQMKAGAMVGVSAGPSVEDWDFRAVLSEYGKRCSAYIRDRQDSPRPFFLYFPMPSPHTPIAPHSSFQGQSGISEYVDFLIQTDAVVGEVLKSIEDSGQSENTIVIFTCDNGTSPQANFPELDAKGIHLNENWRGWKADAYEGGHRVPFFVRWPGKIKRNSRSEQTITLADIMATCAAVVDYKLPPTAAEDSVSLLPTLFGEPSTTPLHELVVHHSGSGHFAVRKGDWKLMFCRGSGGWSPPREPLAVKQQLPEVQLYNLRDDPKETRNLQSQHPEIIRRLKSEFRTMVESGRSTPGPKQPNDNQANWWQGLPWTRE